MEPITFGKKPRIPYLIYSYGKNRMMNTICSISENSQNHPQFIPDLCGKNILGSYLEWVLLEDKSCGEFYFLNIFSMVREEIKFQKSDTANYTNILLSSGPDDTHCHLVCVSRDEGNCVITLCKPGEDYQAIPIWERDLQDGVFDATFFSGKLYCLLIPNYSVIVADVAHSTSSNTDVCFKQLIRGMPRPSRPEFERTMDYLVDAENELLFVHKRYVYHTDEVFHFRIFRADFSNNSWVEIESIGDKTIFLDCFQGVCRSATQAGTRANCIYFTECNDRKVHVFCLEDQSFSTVLPCENISKINVDSIWIWR